MEQNIKLLTHTCLGLLVFCSAESNKVLSHYGQHSTGLGYVEKTNLMLVHNKKVIQSKNHEFKSERMDCSWEVKTGRLMFGDEHKMVVFNQYPASATWRA